MEKRDYGRALLEFRNAAESNAAGCRPYYYAGLAFTGTGDLSRNGGALVRKALAINPKYPNATLRLAELMAVAGDEDSIEGAEKSITESDRIGAWQPRHAENARYCEAQTREDGRCRPHLATERWHGPRGDRILSDFS